MLTVVLILVIFLLLCYLYGTRTYNQFKKSNVKNPPTIPFIGNQWPLFLGKHLISSMKLGYNSFPNERYVGFFDFQRPWVWLRDNNLIKSVCVKDFESFLDHNHILNEKIDVLYSQLLISLKGKKWKEMRTIMTPAFTSSKIKAMMPLIKECTNQLTTYLNEKLDNRIQSGGDILEIEAKDLFTRYANDIIASVAFGLKVDSLRDKENDFYKMGERLTDTDLKFYVTYILNAKMPSVIEFFGISLIDKDANDYFKNVIKYTMKEREESGIKREDMIHLLMEAKKGSLCGEETQALPEDNHDLHYQHTTKTSWTDDELTAQALIFFLAGFESISTFLSFALYELATRQEIQHRLAEEVDSIAASNNNLYDNITSLKYMDMFVSECLRLYPTLPMADRVCTKSYSLPPPNEHSTTSYQVNPGDAISIPIRSIQRDPHYFQNPLQFDPERFSDDNKKNIKPFTFIPFGVGPRQCLGRRFALIELKCALYFLLSQFVFIPCSKTKNPKGLPTKFVSMVPKEGIWVGVKRRGDMNLPGL